MADLVNPITADGDYDLDMPSNRADIIVTGTFGGGTLKLQAINPVDDAVADVADASWTAAATVVYNGANQNKIRFNLAGATTPSINVSVRKA